MPLDTLDRTPPPFFKQGPSALSKLVFFSALSVFLMVADTRFQITSPLRSAVSAVLYPVQWLALQPVRWSQDVGSYFESQKSSQRAEEEARNRLAQQSLRAGHIVRIDNPRTIADGAQANALGPLTFDIIRQHAEGILTASDLQLMQALRFMAERMKIVVEPTGALSFAGAQHGGVDMRGKRVGIIISGGNVDLARYARFLAD